MVFGIAILLGSVCIPVGAMFFKINRREDSQAGRNPQGADPPYGTFTLNMQTRLALERAATLPKFRASLP